MDQKRTANYLSHPQTINDILQIVNKVASTNDADERVHYLEVVRDTITRFPGLTGRGLKGKIQRALNALNPRSSIEPSELPSILESIQQLLRSRSARRAAREVDLWQIARRMALSCRPAAVSKQDLFDRTLAGIRRVVGTDQFSESRFLLRYAYNATLQSLTTQLTNRDNNAIMGEMMEETIGKSSKTAAHTQAEVDFTARIVGAHMKAFIQEQKEAEEKGDTGGAMMTSYEGILDEGIKFLIYLASNEEVITGFPPLPPSAIKAIKKLEADADFRQAVYDQVEADYGIDMDLAKSDDPLGLGGAGWSISQSEIPAQIKEEKEVAPATPPYSAEDFQASTERGEQLKVVDELGEGEMKDVSLSTLAQILRDAPKEDDTFGYEGRRFVVQHVDFGNKVGLVQRTASQMETASNVEADKHREIPVDDLQIKSTAPVGPHAMVCPKCGNSNAAYKKEQDTMTFSCPDCGYLE